MNHVLAKEGVLTSFSISRKVPANEISKLKAKLNKKIKNPIELQDLIRQTIMKKNEKVPGLLDSLPNATKDEKKSLMEMSYFASIISKKLMEKKIDKYQSCYIINSIINMLGLNEQDFDEFHKRFNKFIGNDEQNESE